MKKFLKSAVAMVIISSSPLFAQKSNDDEGQLAGSNIHHIIGFSYSTVSGAGLTYQYAIDPNYRLKTAGFLFWDENTESAQEDILSYNIGGEFQRTLHRTGVTRLYALAGAQYYYDRRRGGYSFFDPVDKSLNEIELKTIAFGVGLGLEMFAWKNISLNADGNYYFEQTDKLETRSTNTGMPGTPIPNQARRVRFGFGVGIGYAF